MHAALGPHEVHIWFRTTGSAGTADVQAARATLSAGERQRADRFHFSDDCRDYTLAHDLLRRTLSTYRSVEPDGWHFQADAAGKPFLADDPRLSFNLSHTRHLVACAIAAGPPVGIDVERAARMLDAGAIARRYFSADESASLARCRDKDHTMRFVELWTLKEAFVKAVGAGLTMPLDSMSFALDEGGIVFEPPPGYAASEWHFALFEPSGEARLAVAVRAALAPSFVAREIASGGLASAAALHPARWTRTRIAVP
jgi:phosphopantetheine--protein transferase-like protein